MTEPSSQPLIQLPAITPAEIAQAATNAATHAKLLFLRGLPAEAAAAAHHAAELAAEIGHEAEGPLRAMADWFRKFLPKPAPAPVPEPKIPAPSPSTIAQGSEPRATADVASTDRPSTDPASGSVGDAPAQPA